MDQVPAVERQIARDLARHALLASPVVVVVAGLIRGADGAWSAAIAMAIVLGNFLAAAALQSWGASISPGVAGGAVLGGYIIRIAVMFGSAFALREVGFIDIEALVITMAIAHLALLFWELHSVRLSFAEPGLRVRRPSPVPAVKE